MGLQCKAAVLHAPKTPLVIETIEAEEIKADDVLVRIKAVGLCHTDLEVIEGVLRNPMPIVLGHEAAGIVEKVGPLARGVSVGDHVVLSWNPHCGHCFYCDRDLPLQLWRRASFARFPAAGAGRNRWPFAARRADHGTDCAGAGQ